MPHSCVTCCVACCTLRERRSRRMQHATCLLYAYEGQIAVESQLFEFQPLTFNFRLF